MSDGSGEIARPPAGVVAQLFPGRDKEISQFVDLLISAGVERGLIGPREVPRIWDRHVLNCVVIRDLFGRDTTVCDIGSGAGLPGLVLAISRPDLTLTLVEPLLRRTIFLAEAVAGLGLTNVEVVRSRAEQVPGGLQFDAVTARAVAPLERLAGWGLPLCRQGGELIAIKGSSVHDELEAARTTLSTLRAGAVTVEEFGEGITSTPTTVVRIQSSGYVPSPRRGSR